MPVRTKRWNDPRDADDGQRVLICRYRPRGVPKADETWDTWRKTLSPSAELLAAAVGKGDVPLETSEFHRRFLAEMRDAREAIDELAHELRRGATITLLCSSACTDAKRCHRTLVARLLEEAAAESTSEVGNA